MYSLVFFFTPGGNVVVAGGMKLKFHPIFLHSDPSPQSCFPRKGSLCCFVEMLNNTQIAWSNGYDSPSPRSPAMSAVVGVDEGRPDPGLTLWVLHGSALCCAQNHHPLPPTWQCSLAVRAAGDGRSQCSSYYRCPNFLSGLRMGQVLWTLGRESS
jgi:hypothetical protein